MQRKIKYIFKGVAIVFSLLFIVCIIYLYLTYRAFSSNQLSNFSPLIVKLFDKLGNNKQLESKIKFKSEETIKILEGWSSQEIANYLDNAGKWSSAKFLESTGRPQTDYRLHSELKSPQDWSSKFSFLSDKPAYYSLEGYLFPDTYRVYTSSTEEEIIEKMLLNFDSKLTSKMRDDIKAQGKTIYNIVTMASLIEKEAPLNYQTTENRDARLISGIFWRRLKNGQRLESDASLSYVFNDANASHSGKELEVDSPYNTYKYRGLPVGPICNPSITAIEAAIYPIVTNYNYFLTPDNTNTVIYSRTYDEHLRNKYKYLK